MFSGSVYNHIKDLLFVWVMAVQLARSASNVFLRSLSHQTPKSERPLKKPEAPAMHSSPASPPPASHDASSLSEAAMALHLLSQSPPSSPSPPRASPHSTPTSHPARRLRWGNVRTDTFAVALGRSGVPSRGGPAIGLADSPIAISHTTVEERELEIQHTKARRFSRKERLELLSTANIDRALVKRNAREANLVRKSRRRTVIELKAFGSDDEMDDEEDVSTPVLQKRTAEDMSVEGDELSGHLVKRPRMVPSNYI